MRKPPPGLEWWSVYLAIGVLPLNGSEKAVLTCLVDHANSKSGRCVPSEGRIAAMIKRPLRTVERAVTQLGRTPYLSVKPRPQSSNSYSINFDALLKAFDAYKAQGAAYSARKATYRRTVPEPVTLTVTEPVTLRLKSHPSKVAGHTIKSGGSTPSKAAANNKKIKVKEEKKFRMASPLRGDAKSVSLLQPAGRRGEERGGGARGAPLLPPVGEVRNPGGVIARFERLWRKDEIPEPNLKPWFNWLHDYALEGD